MHAHAHPTWAAPGLSAFRATAGRGFSVWFSTPRATRCLDCCLLLMCHVSPCLLWLSCYIISPDVVPCLFSQIDATLDAYIKPDVFEQIPMNPNSMPKTGKEVFLVSKQEGRIARVPGVDIIRGLASFRCVLWCLVRWWWWRVFVCVCVCVLARLEHT